MKYRLLLPTHFEILKIKSYWREAVVQWHVVGREEEGVLTPEWIFLKACVANHKARSGNGEQAAGTLYLLVTSDHSPISGPSG